jgi:hypothetical protein
MPAHVGKAITGPTDPRWVLAVRTAESLQGTILAPERRERLVRIGKMLGLTPFDANLIIAIVQDQARRGFEPSYCPAAGEKLLEMVPLPGRSRPRLKGDRWMTVAVIIAALLLTELLILRWLL